MARVGKGWTHQKKQTAEKKKQIAEQKKKAAERKAEVEKKRIERAEKRKAAKKAKMLAKVPPENANKLILKPSKNLWDCSANAAMIHGFLDHHKDMLTVELKEEWSKLVDKGIKAKASEWRSTFSGFFLETTGLGDATMENEKAAVVDGTDGLTKTTAAETSGSEKKKTARDDMTLPKEDKVFADKEDYLEQKKKKKAVNKDEDEDTDTDLSDSEDGKNFQSTTKKVSFEDHDN